MQQFFDVMLCRLMYICAKMKVTYVILKLLVVVCVVLPPAMQHLCIIIGEAASYNFFIT